MLNYFAACLDITRLPDFVRRLAVAAGIMLIDDGIHSRIIAQHCDGLVAADLALGVGCARLGTDAQHGGKGAIKRVVPQSIHDLYLSALQSLGSDTADMDTANSDGIRTVRIERESR